MWSHRGEDVGPYAVRTFSGAMTICAVFMEVMILRPSGDGLRT